VDRKRERIVSRARHCGQFFGRGRAYALLDWSSIFAFLQPRLSADYADAVVSESRIPTPNLESELDV
jgi:hypothetical protein